MLYSNVWTHIDRGGLEANNKWVALRVILMRVKYLLLFKGYLNITSTLFSQISATSSAKLMEDLAILQEGKNSELGKKHSPSKYNHNIKKETAAFF